MRSVGGILGRAFKSHVLKMALGGSTISELNGYKYMVDFISRGTHIDPKIGYSVLWVP